MKCQKLTEPRRRTRQSLDQTREVLRTLAEGESLKPQHRALRTIRPSPENDKLYGPIDPNDPEIVALAESLKENGQIEPLILSRDGYIISGHRRYAAARVAGLVKLLCRIDADVSHDGAPELFLRRLRECNRQRVKTAAEKIREEVVSANREDTHRALVAHRREKATMVNSLDRLDLGESKDRKEISSARGPLLAAAKAVLEERRAFWPLSDRQIHYAILNNPPLIHAKKPGSVYRNNVKSYRALTDLLTRARVAGLVPFDAIGDETRPVNVWGVHQDVQGFLRKELNGLLKDYFRDLMQSQPNHIEIMIEKNTVLSIINPIAAEYCIPITSGRGFCSLPPRYEIACRFRKSGKERLVLLMISDFDPEGETISTSMPELMRDDFKISQMVAFKVALTHEQVKRFHLPPGLKAKAGSSTRKRFVEKFGEHVFELEALKPEDLQAITREAIDRVLDLPAFDLERDHEMDDSAELDKVRRAALAAIEQAMTPPPPPPPSKAAATRKRPRR